MLFLLSFLACYPEHNPEDVATIHAFRDELDAAQTARAESQTALESAQDQMQSLQHELEGYKVVATHYASEHKFAGNSLVVCHSMPPDPTHPGTLPFAGIPRPAWIQATVSQDCGEPQLLVYGSPPPMVVPGATERYSDGLRYGMGTEVTF